MNKNATHLSFVGSPVLKASNRPDRANNRRGALARALNFEGAAVPSEIHLLPAGEVEGRDGRHWRNLNPDGIIAAFEANQGPIVVDYEHASDMAQYTGQAAPAAGWIESLENRDGAIWAQVSWTEKAHDMIAAKEYRFISPVFYYHYETGDILEIESVALTNQPNLVLTALNNKRPVEPFQPRENEAMNSEQYKALCRRLGLKEDASVESVMAALDAQSADLQTARNRASNPSLDDFVPRADHDAMKLRAETAEGKIADEEGKALNTKAESAVDAAIAAGKIAPASKDYHVAACKQDGGLAAFEKFVADTPVNPALEASDLNDGQPAGAAGTLSEAEKAMCKRTGVSEAEFIATRDGKPLPSAQN